MDYFPTDLEATPKKFRGTGLQQLWMQSIRELACFSHGLLCSLMIYKYSKESEIITNSN